MNNNLEILLYSTKHPEDILKEEYNHFYWHLKEGSETADEYVKIANNIRKIIEQIKKQSKNRNYKNKKLIIKLDENICKKSNCSPFVMFFNVVDVTLSVYKKLTNSERYSILEKMLKLFFKERNLYPAIDKSIITGILDKGASRRQGNAGEMKLNYLLEKRLKFTLNESFKQISDREFCFISNGNWHGIKKMLGIRYNIAENKKPDVLVKFKNEYFIVEAKHIKESGGSQNTQINELIKMISLHEGVHCLAFLDGIYANAILTEKKILEYAKNRTREINSQATKIENQTFKIFRNIADHPNNYFVNTAGFIKIFKK